jgi:hypothetical protein
VAFADFRPQPNLRSRRRPKLVTQRAIDILNRWIEDTVKPVPPEEMSREANRLANEFTAYAADTGLSIERLEIDLGEDLAARMTEALETAADAESGHVLTDD